MNILRMGITGAQGVGKTTLINNLTNTFKEKDIEILPETIRDLKKYGIFINEQGTIDTQLMVLSIHLNNLLTHKRFIANRILLDGFIYTKYLYNKGKVSKWVFDYAYNLCNEYLGKYNYIFYVPAEFDLISDGVRSDSVQFYNEIIKLFEHYIPIFNEKFNNIYTVTGTVKQRSQRILDVINNEI